MLLSIKYILCVIVVLNVLIYRTRTVVWCRHHVLTVINKHNVVLCSIERYENNYSTFYINHVCWKHTYIYIYLYFERFLRSLEHGLLLRVVTQFIFGMIKRKRFSNKQKYFVLPPDKSIT